MNALPGTGPLSGVSMTLRALDESTMPGAARRAASAAAARDTDVDSACYTACIVAHDASDHLAATLNAVLALSPAPAEVLVVDSGSTDGTPEAALAHASGIRVIRLTTNLGPAAARNAGIGAARYPRILFVDDDVTPDRNCAARLLAALSEHPRAAAVMPTVLHAHDPARVQYDGADAHFSGLMTLQARNTGLPSADPSPRLIGSLVSACFLFDRSRATTLRFDERFFIYFEDHDFALRARIAGWELLSAPAARCHHGLGSAGLSLRRTGEYASLRVLCVIRNRWALMLKTYELRTLLLLAPVLALYELLQVVLVVRRGWAREWLAAASSIIRSRRELLADRREIQSQRVVRDRVLLGGGPLPLTDRLSSTRVERLALRAVDALMAAYWRTILRRL